MKDYHINIFYSEEDEAYIADIPDLKFCSAIGGSPEQVLHEVLRAKTVWLEAAEAEDTTIPKPRYRHVIYKLWHSLCRMVIGIIRRSPSIYPQ